MAWLRVENLIYDKLAWKKISCLIISLSFSSASISCYSYCCCCYTFYFLSFYFFILCVCIYVSFFFPICVIKYIMQYWWPTFYIHTIHVIIIFHHYHLHHHLTWITAIINWGGIQQRNSKGKVYPYPLIVLSYPRAFWAAVTLKKFLLRVFFANFLHNVVMLLQTQKAWLGLFYKFSCIKLYVTQFLHTKRAMSFLYFLAELIWMPKFHEPKIGKSPKST